MIATDKKIDAVKLMRSIREEMHKKYEKQPSLRRRELDKIRKKYGLTKKS